MINGLKELGASLSCTDNEKKQPMHYAAEYGQESAIRCLWGLGAEIDCRDRNGCVPLHYASKGNHIEAVKFWVKRPFSAIDPHSQ